MVLRTNLSPRKIRRNWREIGLVNYENANLGKGAISVMGRFRGGPLYELLLIYGLVCIILCIKSFLWIRLNEGRFNNDAVAMKTQ